MLVHQRVVAHQNTQNTPKSWHPMSVLASDGTSMSWCSHVLHCHVTMSSPLKFTGYPQSNHFQGQESDFTDGAYCDSGYCDTMNHHETELLWSFHGWLPSIFPLHVHNSIMCWWLNHRNFLWTTAFPQRCEPWTSAAICFSWSHWGQP